MNPPPNCPRCGNNYQVWVNQLSGRLTCHRIGCHVEIPESFNKTVARRIAIWEKAAASVDLEELRLIKSRKPSIFSRLFSRISQKRRGWSGKGKEYWEK